MNIGSTIHEIGGLGRTVRRWNVEDFIKGSDDGPHWFVVMTSGKYRAIVRESDLRDRLQETKPRRGPMDTTDAGRWRRFDPQKRGQGIVDVEPRTDYDKIDRMLAPRKASQLDWSQISGKGSRKTVNAFLDHPALVGHGLGSVHGWKAAFVARSPIDGGIVGSIVLSRPASRALDDGTRIEVKRLATRADRPPNTASWMLARAARWAEQHDYEIIQAYAGFAGNRGTCYDAAGFGVAKETEVKVERDGWNSADDRDGRVQIMADGGTWTRRRWERRLD